MKEQLKNPDGTFDPDKIEELFKDTRPSRTTPNRCIPTLQRAFYLAAITQQTWSSQFMTTSKRAS